MIVNCQNGVQLGEEKEREREAMTITTRRKRVAQLEEKKREEKIEP